MSIIQILPAEIAGRIAAGEVIERPASVVKELVENSIDAGATRIRIQIEQGGQRLIQVTDNGCGMDRQDALMCLEAHATSKLTKDGDVGQISTLGFRGEAIPSIASVSRFQLQTRRKEDAIGTEIIVDNGTVHDVTDCGCAPGTNIRVGYLFGNLPARRKFLKGPDTEDGHIQEMVLTMALTRPDIAFTLSINGRDVIKTTAGNDIATRIMMLFGRDIFAAMIPVDYEEDGIHVYGFVTTPGYTRSSRRDQRLIINGRAAAAETLFFAIREAYSTLILKGRYPATVLYIALAPERVDVNVHPSKREVRFREPRQVGLVVTTAIRMALRTLPGMMTALPSTEAASEPPIETTTEQTVFSDESAAPSFQPAAFQHAPSQQEFDTPLATAVPEPPPIIPEIYDDAPVTPTPSEAPAPLPCVPPIQQSQPLRPPQPARAPAPVVEQQQPPPAASPTASLSLTFCGRLGKRFVLAENPSGLVIVDLRAAHQRILFERLLDNLQKKHVIRQQLLIPITINLSLDEARYVRSAQKQFDEIGFSLEDFGGTSFLLTAIPASFPDQELLQTICDIIDDLRHNRTSTSQNAIHLAQVASRHAISKRDVLTDQEITQLLDDLAHTQMPYAAPGGNATMVHFSFSELEKRFRNG